MKRGEVSPVVQCMYTDEGGRFLSVLHGTLNNYVIELMVAATLHYEIV